MGTYFRYVNHTRREYVRLHELRDGGDKMSAALWCSAALAYLMMPGYLVEFHGRWHAKDIAEGLVFRDPDEGIDDAVPDDVQLPVVQIEADHGDWWYEMEARGYVNITSGLLAEMRVNEWDIFDRVVQVEHRMCPEYTEVFDDILNCIHPADHVGRHEYGQWVALTGDELKQWRRRHGGN